MKTVDLREGPHEEQPLEVAIRVFGWGPGESVVEISIPDTSELAGVLRELSSDEAAAVFSRLCRRLTAELSDALHFLDATSRIVGVHDKHDQVAE